MFFDRRVSVFWFSSFYLLESAPILAVAAVAGNVIGFFSPVGWPFVCTLLAAFFAHRLVLSIQFNNYLARKEAAGFAGVDVGPFNTINFLAYAAAFVGAVAGWHLAVTFISLPYSGLSSFSFLLFTS